MVKATLMTGMLVLGLGNFIALMVPRLRLLLKLQPEPLFDAPLTRFVGMMKFAVGQYRMPRDLVPGIMHIFIYIGFLIVSIATITHFVHGFAPNWHFPFLSGTSLAVYTLVKDCSELLVIGAVVYALWRRLGPKPTRVGRSAEGVFVLLMILMLMLSDFAIAAGEWAVHPSNAPGLGGRVALMLLGFLPPPLVAMVGEGSYYLHCALVLMFLNFLPLGKHFHVITSFFNVYFRNLKHMGYLPAVDLENTEQFGIDKTKDLSWSMALDVYSCTECGRCNMYCPTVLTHKPLSHRALNTTIKKALYEDLTPLLAGQTAEALPELVQEKRVLKETIWACTTCGSCEQECPVYIENVPRIIQMRQSQVLLKGDIAPELARVYKGMENQSNPWGIDTGQRDSWAQGLNIPTLAELPQDGPTPLLYWIGCAGSFDDRNKKITLAMISILNAAKVNYAILGKEEGCTGDIARRTGNEYLFQMLAKNNIAQLNNYRVSKILTHCPHCLHTLKADYPQFGGHFEVIHHTQFIEQLLIERRLSLKQNADQQAIAWHDSCYLGRYHNIYDAPRNIVKNLTNTQVVELPRHGSRSVCCGAGGGRFWMEETIGERINVHRAQEAVDTQASTVGSSCPFCLVMLRDGIAHLGQESTKTLDIAEIVAQHLA